MTFFNSTIVCLLLKTRNEILREWVFSLPKPPLFPCPSFRCVDYKSAEVRQPSEDRKTKWRRNKQFASRGYWTHPTYSHLDIAFAVDARIWYQLEWRTQIGQIAHWLLLLLYLIGLASIVVNVGTRIHIVWFQFHVLANEAQRTENALPPSVERHLN